MQVLSSWIPWKLKMLFMDQCPQPEEGIWNSHIFTTGHYNWFPVSVDTWLLDSINGSQCLWTRGSCPLTLSSLDPKILRPSFFGIWGIATCCLNVCISFHGISDHICHQITWNTNYLCMSLDLSFPSSELWLYHLTLALGRGVLILVVKHLWPSWSVLGLCGGTITMQGVLRMIVRHRRS